MLRTLQGERETKPVHRDPESHKEMKTGAIVMGQIRNRLTALKKSKFTKLNNRLNELKEALMLCVSVT